MRKGIRQEVTHHADMEVVADTADGYETLELVRQLQPDVVILDIKLARLDAVEVTRALQEITWQTPHCPTRCTSVLVFSAYGDTQYIWSLLAAGARGYLLKNEPPEQLIEGIRCVAAKQTVLSQSVQTRMIELIPRLNQELSDSEARVLQLLAHGMSNREIANELHITEGTVKAHLNNTYRKIPWIRTRAEAIAWAWINRIVPD
ncbi:MAG: response regulator transcription factor [Anaerolineae bacterium]|nr:response regulator transcription factor [Anaerolineae bacterium]